MMKSYPSVEKSLSILVSLSFKEAYALLMK